MTGKVKRNVSVERDRISRLAPGTSCFIDESRSGPVRSIITRLHKEYPNRSWSVVRSANDPSGYDVIRTDDGVSRQPRSTTRTEQKRSDARSLFNLMPDDMQEIARVVCLQLREVELPYYTGGKDDKEWLKRVKAACVIFMRGGRETNVGGKVYVRMAGGFEHCVVDKEDGTKSLKFWRVW